METHCSYLPYSETGYFSRLVTDYLSGAPALQAFAAWPPSAEGIQQAVQARQALPVNRAALVEALRAQYAPLPVQAAVQNNIESLLSPGTFTVTTAHQPNIFTGPLYFVYKILHAIRLAAELQDSLPAYRFVPVYYMGSEDADLDELGQVTVNGQRYTWNTAQTGAVGRMQVDKAFIALINQMEGQLGVWPHGKTIVDMFRKHYREGVSMQQAMQALVHDLFGAYGLVVLVPDDARLKQLFTPVVQKELSEQFSHRAVAETIAAFPPEYKVQAGGRELNLFYLLNDRRERIEKESELFTVPALRLRFTPAEMAAELQNHPERFSPNVILRGVFQESILPNVAFIGGGGEMAYWLELKKVFEAVQVPFPVLVLRNSFTIVTGSQQQQWQELGFALRDLFRTEEELMNELVKKQSSHPVELNGQMQKLEEFYASVQQLSGAIDPTLAVHVEALKSKTVKQLRELEKKMLRAEKRKFHTQQQRLHKIQSSLFPGGGLQERVENLSGFYARFGPSFIHRLYEHSRALHQQFGLVVASES